MRAELDDGADEQLVALRRVVLNDVEHAVGNLLQRLHHAARTAGTGSGTPGERLQSTLNDLERLLELLFDYVSPVAVQVRPTSVDRIAESLAAQLRAQGPRDVAQGSAPNLQVLADPRVLSRSFLLLAQACVRDGDGTGAMSIEIVPDPAGDRVQFVVQSAGESGATGTAHGSLAAAVAGRLIELQGGELHAWPRPGCACTVALPVAN